MQAGVGWETPFIRRSSGDRAAHPEPPTYLSSLPSYLLSPWLVTRRQRPADRVRDSLFELFLNALVVYACPVGWPAAAAPSPPTLYGPVARYLCEVGRRPPPPLPPTHLTYHPPTSRPRFPHPPLGADRTGAPTAARRVGRDAAERPAVRGYCPALPPPQRPTTSGTQRHHDVPDPLLGILTPLTSDRTVSRGPAAATRCPPPPVRCRPLVAPPL